MITEIKVTDCHMCNLHRYDSDYGYYGCSIDHSLEPYGNKYSEMPSDDVHINCPLKKQEIKFVL